MVILRHINFPHINMGFFMKNLTPAYLLIGFMTRLSYIRKQYPVVPYFMILFTFYAIGQINVMLISKKICGCEILLNNPQLNNKI